MFRAERIILAASITAAGLAWAAPPVITGCGEHLAIADRVTVIEGTDLDVVVEAADPDGDVLTWSAEGLPDWIRIDPATGRLTGHAPLWSEEVDQRSRETGSFDLFVSVTDGTWTVTRVVTVEIQDASWQPMTVAEWMASRPVVDSAPLHTAVELRNVQETIITSQFGGVQLRRICFGFTSQVPSGEGRENDWATETSCAYLPVGEPAVPNVGAVAEGCYSRDFGEARFAEHAAALLGIPVLVMDLDWDWDHPSDMMQPYNQTAISTRDPGELFYAFSTYHFLRSADALATVIDTYTSQAVDFDSFKAAYTGFSKFGHTAFLTAGADPSRTVGFLATGAAGIDGSAGRLLGIMQGASSFSPETHPGYLGNMMRAYAIDRHAQAQANPDTFALEVLGTDEHRDDPEDYTAKYAALAADGFLTLPSRRGTLPNAPHTTRTPIHDTMWSMLLAHLFLGRPLASIEATHHRPAGDGIEVTAVVAGETTVQQVDVWATSQDDRSVGAWNDFEAYPAEEVAAGTYLATIPADSVTFFVEVRDTAAEVPGLVYSAPEPMDPDYPLLGIPPGEVGDLHAAQGADGWTLSWENPGSPDLVGVLLVVSPDHAPASPLDGTVVYDGTEEEAVVEPSVGLQTGHVTAFTYDAEGNYSSGVSVALSAPRARRPSGRVFGSS